MLRTASSPTRHQKIGARIAVLAALALSLATPAIQLHAQTTGLSAGSSLPTRLSDSAFWNLVNDISEPGGRFRSDNFVSNETTLQWVIPELLRTTKPGGVYLGVGPDQNFTYIVALQPKISFIFDIRRQNMLTHLMYKALIEASSDRADFVSRLFALPRPAGLDSTSSAEAIFAAFAHVRSDSGRAHANFADINQALTVRHGFALSEEDLGTIRYVYDSFVAAGPEINYNFTPSHRGFGRMPSFATLQLATDSLLVNHSYLATEANFRALKDVQTNNLLVPVVGNFAGKSAIRKVGDYLRQHDATVTAFYLSNVEQYLFQQGDDAGRFYRNVGALPLDETSTFIRSVFIGKGGFKDGYESYMRNEQLVASMMEQVKLFSAGKLSGYSDVIQTPR